MEDLFKELYDYIEPYHAGWKKQLKPASTQLINKFIKLSRMKEYADRIPRSYFEFLERMGQDDGGLLSNLYGGGTINPKELMDEIKHKGQPIYFDLSTENSKEIWEGCSNPKRMSESFEKLLFQCAFDWFVKYKFEKSYWTNGKEEYYRIIQVVESYGIKETWFSDPNNYRGEGENIAFSMKYCDDGQVCGKITSQDERAKVIFEILYAAPVEACGRNGWHVQGDGIYF